VRPSRSVTSHLAGGRAALASALLLLIGSHGASGEPKEMTFENHCARNAVEYCYVIADGMITANSPAAFQTLLDEGVDGNQIVFNSEGGNLGAAVQLGRLLRENGFNAEIGEGSDIIAMNGGPLPGHCLSACAYAFLGGVERRYDGRSQLGFHQFSLSGGQSMGLADAQILSGQLISYIVEMGADARIFTQASREGSDSFYYVGEQEAQDLGLATPHGYGAFFLEPFGGGVIAAARRRDPPKPYDEVVQVTAFCRGDMPHLLFSAALVPDYSARLRIEVDGQVFTIGEQDVQTRMGNDSGVIEVRLDSTAASHLQSARSVATSFGFGRADGGEFRVQLQLGDMDRKMISTAFRFCI
jgi:hypothetical protein